MTIVRFAAAIASLALAGAPAGAATGSTSVSLSKYRQDVAAAEQRGYDRGFAEARDQYERCLKSKGKSAGTGTAIGAGAGAAIAAIAGGNLGTTVLAAGAGGLAGNAIGRGQVKC